MCCCFSFNQVFSLDSPDTFSIVYDPSRERERATRLAGIAEQIATLCATLGEYPTVRFRSESELMGRLANVVSTKLDKYKTDNPTMGEVNLSISLSLRDVFIR